MAECRVESAIRGYHVYREIWNPVLGEELTTQREHGNPEDAFAVKIKKGDETVGHIGKELSKICWLFLHDGSIVAEVTSCSKRRSPIVQGGLEIPCTLTL